MSDVRTLEAREAELSTLGAVMLDNDALARVARLLQPESFASPRHRLVWAAMLELDRKGEPIDPFTLLDELGNDGEAAGGMAYLSQLAEASATAVNVEHHARIVAEAAERRALVAACEGIVRAVKGGAFESNVELFSEAQRAVMAVSAHRNEGGLVSFRAGLRGAVSSIKGAYETKAPVTGTPTGFADFDAKTSGLHPGELLILAARPAMGKTALALSIAANTARLSGGAVAVFSLEMPMTALAKRMIACEARIEGERLKNGTLDAGDIDRMLEAVKRLNHLPLYVDDSSSTDLNSVWAECRRLVADKSVPPLKLVVIDYLQIMNTAQIRGSNREQAVSELTRGLKRLARELGVTVIALSQLNRGVESRPNKRPGLADLRESGAIEQEADLVMFCYRDEYYHEDSPDKGIAEIIIGKHRSGSTGTVKLRFTKAWIRFDDLAAASGPARGAWQ